MEGYFEKEFVLTPDYCDARAGLSPYGAFTIFQELRPSTQSASASAARQWQSAASSG